MQEIIETVASQIVDHAYNLECAHLPAWKAKPERIAKIMENALIDPPNGLGFIFGGISASQQNTGIIREELKNAYGILTQSQDENAETINRIPRSRANNDCQVIPGKACTGWGLEFNQDFWDLIDESDKVREIARTLCVAIVGEAKQRFPTMRLKSIKKDGDVVIFGDPNAQVA